tara:strand:+ start:3667 stop:4068 length:402 start_codon:yes stop_codon:yes gene_type:complete
MANRNYPNDYFAWYNDDRRLAVLELDTTSTSGEKNKEKYDSFQSETDVSNGLRITYHSKYEAVSSSNLTSELSTAVGIDTGLQDLITCFVKARLYEDMGDLQKAQYYRMMYEKELKQYPSRKSGVRALSVPRM